MSIEDPKVDETRRYWGVMTFYERFEQTVALILSICIAFIIAGALLQLVIKIGSLVLSGSLDLLDHAAFQTLFGMIMTLLIAMEFKHSIIRVAMRRDNIIQVRTVILIALLALARKFIILDTATLTAAKIAALSGAVVALGIVYWVIRDRELRDEESRTPCIGDRP